MKNKIAVIGGGSWGTALATILAKNNYDIEIYVRDNKLKKDINHKHINTAYFPDIKLSNNIKATNNLKEMVVNAENIVVSVPTDATRIIMNKIKPYLDNNKIIVSTAKGIEEKTYLRNSQIIKEITDNPVAVLSGPTHAEEVIKKLPSAAVAASKNRKIAEKIQDMFMTRTFRVYTNPDIVGVEMGGAIKNIIAIAAGITDGLGYGEIQWQL